MYVTSPIIDKPTKSQIKNIIFYDPDATTPIISCNLFKTELE
jgi:hypothetical protein